MTLLKARCIFASDGSDKSLERAQKLAKAMFSRPTNSSYSIMLGSSSNNDKETEDVDEVEYQLMGGKVFHCGNDGAEAGATLKKLNKGRTTTGVVSGDPIVFSIFVDGSGDDNEERQKQIHAVMNMLHHLKNSVERNNKPWVTIISSTAEIHERLSEGLPPWLRDALSNRYFRPPQIFCFDGNNKVRVRQKIFACLANKIREDALPCCRPVLSDVPSADPQQGIHGCALYLIPVKKGNFLCSYTMKPDQTSATLGKDNLVADPERLGKNDFDKISAKHYEITRDAKTGQITIKSVGLNGLSVERANGTLTHLMDNQKITLKDGDTVCLLPHRPDVGHVISKSSVRKDANLEKMLGSLQCKNAGLERENARLKEEAEIAKKEAQMASINLSKVTNQLIDVRTVNGDLQKKLKKHEEEREAAENRFSPTQPLPGYEFNCSSDDDDSSLSSEGDNDEDDVQLMEEGYTSKGSTQDIVGDWPQSVGTASTTSSSNCYDLSY